MDRENQFKSGSVSGNNGRYIWLLVLGVITLLVLTRHENTGYFNWRGKLWADQAGYYVYLPAFFIYGFDGNNMPDSIAEKTGDGFAINEQGKVITRYTTGVAIMQAPFFLAVHGFAGFTGQKQDGFSGAYHYVSSVAAIFYAFAGLLLLYHFLLYYYKKGIAILSLVTIFLGTNLLYYTIDATGMSHIYSFFLFAVLLLLSKKFFTGNGSSRKQNLYFTGIAVVSALIVLVRPTNLVFVALVFLLDINSIETLKERIKLVFAPGRIFMVVSAFILIFLPQMLYWKYSSGSFITDSYEGYGFTNWNSPQIIKFLFSPNNGMFLYNPLYFIICLALVVMVRHKQKNGYYIAATLAGLIYLFSSWFIFSFGCGFGSRNFVEYTAIFTLPLGFLLSKLIHEKKLIKLSAGILLILFVLVNMKLTYSYDKCFGGNDWDFKEYAYLLKNRKYTKIIPYSKKEYLTPEKEYSKGININMKYNTLVNYRRAYVTITTELFEKDTEAIVVVSITRADSTIYWNGYPLKSDYNFESSGEPQIIKAEFYLPRYYTTNSIISSYVWNIGKDSLSVLDYKIHLE